MRLYAGSVSQFRADTQLNQIAEKLKTAYFFYFRQNPSPAEISAWRNSLRATSELFGYCRLDDHGVILEYQLPLSSKRLDCLVTGKDAAHKGNAIIIELKQWEACQAADGDNEVMTYLGGGERQVLHPSVQVGRYRTYLEDYHAAFYEGPDPLGLSACSYLHNYRFIPDDALLAAKFAETLRDCPVFSADDVPELREFLMPRVGRGQGIEVLNRVLDGTYRPSKKLMDHVVEVIAGNSEFVLLDEQLVVFDDVLSTVARGIHEGRKQVVLVRGGPGTGKSVIAINLMSELMKRGFNAHYATGSKAFTQTLRKVIGPRGAGQFRYFNSYPDAERDEVDALICDEAHRLRESSNDRFHPKKGRPGISQIDELFNAGRVGVFFIDDDQVVRPGEIGSAEYIRASAVRSGCEVREYELDIQFRCGGSDAFVKWVENTLEIRKTPHVLWSPNEDFDFRILDSPQALETAIKGQAAKGFKARMMAGFCWPWAKKLSGDGSLVNDVVVGSYVRPWNANPEIRKLPKGIPPAPVWANDPNGLNQIGCVYTAQGFEFDYAGVIFGTDLRYNFNLGTWAGYPEDSHDSVVKRAKGSFTDLVKNTYRVLLSRAHKGCYVCFLDKETEKFFRSRVEADPGVEGLSKPDTAYEGVPQKPHGLFIDALPLAAFGEDAGEGQERRAGPETVPVPPGEYGSAHFVFRAEDARMAPQIVKGALCLFRRYGGEPIDGKIVLMRAKSRPSRIQLAMVRRRSFLDVREGDGAERMVWTAEFADAYAQPILFGDLGDIEILGILEKVFPS